MVVVGVGLGCTALAVAAVAGKRLLICALKVSAFGMLAGGTTMSTEENSASATLSSTVISAAKACHATHPPLCAASRTQRRFATVSGSPVSSFSGSGGGALDLAGTLRGMGGQEDMAQTASS